MLAGLASDAVGGLHYPGLVLGRELRYIFTHACILHDIERI